MKKKVVLPSRLALSILLFLLSFIFFHRATAAPMLLQAGSPFADQRQAIDTAVNWLVTTQQNEDGGYGIDFNSSESLSNMGSTVDAILAVAAAGYNPAALTPGTAVTSIDYLARNPEALDDYVAQGGGATGKLILALTAANQNPRDFSGRDWVAVLTGQLSAEGDYSSGTAFTQALAILGLTAVHEPIPPQAVDWLLSRQSDQDGADGSWDDGFGTTGNPDATALAIMALLAADLPVTDTSVSRAVDFLAQSQLESGGWEYGTGFGENGNSTALVVQALSALGEDFYSPTSTWARDGRSPLAVLLAWQSESGAFQADFGSGPFDDFFTTVQAIPALTGKPLPLPARHEAARRAVGCLAALQDSETGGWEEFPGSGVSAGGTARAIQALTAVGFDPRSDEWTVNGTSAVQALENLTPDYLAHGRGGRAGIVMLGVVAAGADVTDFAGYNLVISMTQHLSPTGEYDDTGFGPYAHSRAMLGLVAAGQPVAPEAVSWLLQAANDGDWGGPDSSGLAVNVLGRLGEGLPEGAIQNLVRSQEADGGWGFDGSNPSSTSEVAQGLVSAGQNPFAPTWSQLVNGRVVNPADVIMAQQLENGCWPNLYGPGDDPFSTTDAMLLLAQRPVWPDVLEFEPVVDAPVVEAVTTTPESAVLETAVPVATDEPELVAESAPTVVPASTDQPYPPAEPAAPAAETAAPAVASRSLVPYLIILLVVLTVGGATYLVRRSGPGR